MSGEMILNVVSGPSTSKKQKVTGGRWVDRARQNKRESRRVSHVKPSDPAAALASSSPGSQTAATQSIDANVSARPANSEDPRTSNAHLKRKRPEGRTQNSAISRDQSSREHVWSVDGEDTRPAGQVVSSIFDFNDPLPVMAPSVTAHRDRNTQPSNAPLTDSSTFESVGLIHELITTMGERFKVVKPTIIQKKVLPILLKSSKDVFIRAETGSGKTLAYLLPILNRLCQLPPAMQAREKGCYALLIAPTRELAQQIYNVLDSMLNSRKARWIVGVLLIGGEKKKSEKARLRKGANIVIATPGRLQDHLDSTKVLDVSAMRWVVLDEGDRLMDLGFEKSIINILDTIKQRQGRWIAAPSLPDRRVTVICSATAKENIKELGEQNLEDAVFVEGREDDLHADREQTGTVAPAQLRQEYVVVPTKLRLTTLVATLKKSFSPPKACKKIIVFFSCGDSVDWHFSAFSRAVEGEERVADATQPSSISSMPTVQSGLKLHKLHGSLLQQIRTQTLQSFSTCTEPAVLFCTDVASRGLDIQVDKIVQYDPPFSIDDYTHRIGRTARAGRSGSALLFTLKSESEYLDYIKTTLHCDLEEINVKFLLKSGFGTNFEDTATQWQLSYEKWANTAGTIDRAKSAFTSHVRAYATHLASERKCFPMHGLQLGHVAKSFGLRDAPSTIGSNLPKQRVEGKAIPSEREKKGESQRPTDIQMRMRRSIAAQSGASEFNLM